MLVRSSHLALRFYVSDGWDRQKVSQYVVGKLVEKDGGLFSNDPKLNYFIPDISARVDAVALIEDGHKIQDYSGYVLDGRAAVEYARQII